MLNFDNHNVMSFLRNSKQYYKIEMAWDRIQGPGLISNHHGNKHLIRSVVESARGEEDARDVAHMYAY